MCVGEYKVRCWFCSSEGWGAWFFAVHGFLQADDYVNEDEFLDIVFQLNVKGMTQLGSGFVVSGRITAAADGTSSKQCLPQQ